MKIIDRIGWGTFRGKLFIISAVGSAGTVVLLTAIWMAYARNAIDATVHRDLEVIAKRSAAEIDQYLSGKMDTLRGIKELLSYPDEDRFKLALMLKRIELEFNQYANISLFDASNKLIASSSPDAPASLSEDILGIVKKGKTYRSPLFFTHDNLPYMRLAVPIFWQGEVFRILAADINILAVWIKLDDIRIGDTGRASIISEDGAFLADADKGRVLKQQRLDGIFSFENSLTEKGGVVNVRNRDGDVLCLAYAEIPSTGWRLIITQEHREALHFLYVMAYQAGLIMLAALLIAYYLSIRVSRKISLPVEELHKGVQEFERGNLEYKVPPLYGEEMSVLAESLNSMAESIAGKEKMEKELAMAEKMAAIGKLAGNMSHEINNPLAIMKNYIYVMSKNKMAEEDPNQRYLKIIDGEIDRIAKIILDFNDFYKGTVVVKLEKVDLSVPMREILVLCKEDLAAKRITVLERLAEDVTVMAEKDKLKQVFLNLIKNAGEAMQEGGTLTIEAGKDNGRIYVSVTDTGTGIKPEHIGKVFDPFFSTKGVKGMGLGLSVSYGIIKNFKGNIEVESEAGKGTTFRVILPEV